MLIQLHRVLDNPQVQLLTQALKDARFVDGRQSAGERAVQVKNNLELDPGSETAAHLHKIVMGSLYAHAAFRSAALPHRVSTPFIARYTPGMQYGEHIDDPVMGTGQRFRCDIAVTLFLSEPASYAGGELVINTTFGTREVKLAAGDAVLYPASSLHRVAEVTAGERLVAVAWIQSMVRDPARRELLYELDQARETLREERPDAPETAQVDHAYVNLVRMWSEV